MYYKYFVKSLNNVNLYIYLDTLKSMIYSYILEYFKNIVGINCTVGLVKQLKFS